MLQQDIKELESLSIKEDEFEVLNKEHQLLHHARDYLEQIEYIQNVLKGDESPHICKCLHQIQQR